jgi:hypothetical protein
MKWPDEMQIHEVIGPRLERGAVVIETLTPMGQIALKLSTAAAAKLGKAIQTAIGDGFPDLPRFLAADDPNSPKSDRKRIIRKLFRNSGRRPMPRRRGPSRDCRSRLLLWSGSASLPLVLRVTESSLGQPFIRLSKVRGKWA